MISFANGIGRECCNIPLTVPKTKITKFYVRRVYMPQKKQQFCHHINIVAKSFFRKKVV